jgi:CheY-like chemotaxis protein
MNPRTARIVIVEDDPSSIILAKKALKSEGILNMVEFFTNSKDVLEYLTVTQDQPPDLILIDRNLSGSDLQGDAIANQIIENPKLNSVEIGMMSAADIGREKENEYVNNRRIQFFLKTPLITAQLDSVIRKSNRLRKLIVIIDAETGEAA